MKKGINLLLWTVHPTMAEHASLLEQIREWGYDGVEFPIGQTDIAELERLARLCDDLGLERTAAGHVDVATADPTSSDSARRLAARKSLRHAIDKAEVIGSNVLAGPLFQGLGNARPAPPTRDAWKRSVEVIRDAADYAEARHIRIALEPLSRFEASLVNTIADGTRFCRETGSKNVGLLVDTYHANIEEDRPADAWRAASEVIFHVHISENHRGVPGRGHAAGPEMFRALREIGYDDWLTIEAFSRRVEPLVERFRLWRDYFEREDEVAVDGLRFLRDSWAQSGTDV